MAQQIRTGLTEESPPTPNLRVVEGAKGRKDPLDDLFFRKPVRHHVKEFGALFALICLAVTAVRIYRNASPTVVLAWVGAATIFLYLGYLQPRVLYPIWKGWMAFAEKLGSVMTVVIMSILWFVALIPTAIALNIFRKRVMITTFRETVSTYWEDRDPKLNDMKLLERQF